MNFSFFLVLNFLMIIRLFSANTIKSQSLKNFMIQTILSLLVVFLFQPHWMLLALVVLLVFFQLLTFVIDGFVKGSNRFLMRFISLLCFALGLWLLTTVYNVFFQINEGLIKSLVSCWPILQAKELIYHGLVVLWGALFLVNEINQIIVYTISALKILPRSEANQTDFMAIRRGWIIGVLERLLIFILVINLQIGAIGFILAAKGIIRFKKMDDKDFAEYVLIGTLLSTLLAMLVAFAVLLLMNRLS
ncbi:MAG: hypothetical protein JXR70_00980 [Spirochaetales bacterium]|nr:hypothetical protein [Spirochaetales bacterium]